LNPNSSLNDAPALIGKIRSACRIAAWLISLAIIALSLVPPSIRPVTEASHGVEHFAIFAINGMAFAIGYPGRAVLSAIGLVIFAATVEIAQLLAPGRHARLSDFVVDAVAACVGVAAISLLEQFSRKRQAATSGN
jgi:VanZ family protein